MCRRATLEFYFCLKKSRRRAAAQTELLLLILFIIPRPEWSVQLYSALCVGTDYETTRHETDLVLSNTEWEGNIFRRDNLLF